MEFSNEAIVLLAAGNSSRMGTPKQALDIGGQTLLNHAVSCALTSQIPNVVVVFGAHLTDTQHLIQDLRVIPVVNPNWQLGMGSSLKAGVSKAIEINPMLEGVMIMVCDQPKVTVTHINEMGRIHIIKRPLAVASEYNGIVGVPVLFDRSVFSDLLKVDNQSGAKEVLRKIKSEIITLPLAGGEIDLDTPEDYQNFIRVGNRNSVHN
jgi:molybdenum cofactor cytidylyltransferase